MSGEIGRLWLGALAAALIIPILVLAFGAPLWAGATGAFAVFFTALFLPVHEGMARAKPSKMLGFGTKIDHEPALQAALQAALPALARLERAAELAQAPLSQRLHRMVDISRGLIADIRIDPARLAIVQRLLTYYLPSAADIAEGHGQLARAGLAPPARLAAAEALLGRIEAAVGHFASQLVHQDLHELDAEIRLVDSALKDDLGERP